MIQIPLKESSRKVSLQTDYKQTRGKGTSIRICKSTFEIKLPNKVMKNLTSPKTRQNITYITGSENKNKALYIFITD